MQINNGESGMKTEGLKFRLQKSNWSFGLQMLIVQESVSGVRSYVKEMIMETISDGGIVPPSSILEFDCTVAQTLMDDLWDCGVRPTEGKGSAGAMAATEKHLGDMRKLVQKCMKVEL